MPVYMLFQNIQCGPKKQFDLENMDKCQGRVKYLHLTNNSNVFQNKGQVR